MVQNERSILRNTVVAAAGRGAGDLFTFLFLVVFARSFGREVFGEFSFAMAIGALLASLVVPGVNSLLVREVARAPAEGPRLTGAVAGLQLPVAAGLFAALYLFGHLLVDSDRARGVLLIMGGYQLLYTLGLVFRNYFAGREQMHYGAVLEAGHKTLILLGGLLAILLIGVPDGVLLVYPLAAAAMYVAGFALVAARQAAPRVHFDADLSRRWFLESLPLFGSLVLLVVQGRAGFIWLGSTHDAAAVGLFAAGDRLISAAGLLFLMFNTAIFPVMSRLESQELDRLLARCLRVAGTLAVLLAATIVLLREPIIALVFGRDFLPAADVLGLLALGLVATAITGPAHMLMIARHQLTPLLWIRLTSVAVFFAAMALLVPESGFVGLAWSVVVMKATSCVATFAWLSRQGTRVPLLSLLRAPVAAAAGMGAVYTLAEVPLSLRVAMTVAAGALLLVAFKGVGKSDLDYLRRIVRGTA